MKFLRTMIAALVLTGVAFGSPALAKIMNEPDVSGNYYAAEIKDANGIISTSFFELTSDGAGGISYTRLLPEGETGSVLYTVFDDGLFSIKEHPINDEPFGASKGAVSQDGNYLMLGDMVHTTKGGIPSLLLAIKKSSVLDQTAMRGAYNVFIFYKALVDGTTTVVDTNAGTFNADLDLQGQAAVGTLSGEFREAVNPFTNAAQPLTGDYEAAYTVLQDGRLSLTLTSGNSSAAFGELRGVISNDGSVFVAVETSPEDGNQAFVIGIRQRSADLTLADIEGSYYVDDFGYYPFDDEAVNDAAGFLMDLTFGSDGTFNFREIDTTCEPCTILTPIDGNVVVSRSGRQYTYQINGYPEGRKQGGQINLSPDGTVLAMISPLYLGVGLEQASGVGEPGQPVANAGEPQTVASGETVTLDASGSTDPNGTIETYRWLPVTGTSALVSAVTLSDNTAVQPTFTAPNIGGYVTFRLTVTDNDGNTDVDVVTVTVTGNGAPVADAGEDQTVDEGSRVTLDGTGSSDPENGSVTYSWTQTAGPEVTLENAETAEPGFVAPMVDARTEMTFELTVEDESGLTATDTVTVFVTDLDAPGGNQAPLADAGDDKTVCENGTITLNGSRSSDADGEIASYAWTQTAGPDVVLSNANAARASFTAPSVEALTTLTFQLTVTDDGGLTATDTVDIQVDNDGNGNGMPDGNESNDNGDMDGDGSFDFDDPDSARFRYINGTDFIGLYTNRGTLTNVQNLGDTDPDVSQTGRPAGTSCPYGVFSYTITGLTPGQSADVTFVLPKDLQANATFYKINEGGWQPVGIERGEAANTFTVTLTDGDPLTDADGEANGQIVDPSTIGVAQAADDDDDDDDDSCFIRTMFR